MNESRIGNADPETESMTKVKARQLGMPAKWAGGLSSLLCMGGEGGGGDDDIKSFNAPQTLSCLKVSEAARVPRQMINKCEYCESNIVDHKP